MEEALTKLVRKGAEACLYADSYLGMRGIRKERISKPYRHPKLDSEIRSSRTLLEGRLLSDAKRAGVRTPTVFQIDPASTSLLMEYIDGIILRDSLSSMKRDELSESFLKLGGYIARLHNASIIHGDITTSNVILGEDGEMTLIDFGLGEYSQELELRGVDLHLLLRTLESSHSTSVDVCWRSFIAGYKSDFGGDSDQVLAKVREIRRRGRYVEERRKK